jgi:hypothetical protein
MVSAAERFWRVFMALERLAGRWQERRNPRSGTHGEARAVKPWVARLVCFALWLGGTAVAWSQGNVALAAAVAILPMILYMAIEFAGWAFIRRMRDQRRT